MGNGKPTPVPAPAPSSVPPPQQKISHDPSPKISYKSPRFDVSGDKPQPAFSFGSELELVLLPNRWKLLKSAPELGAMLDAIPTQIGKGKDTNQRRQYSNACRQWAEFVAIFLDRMLSTELEQVPSSSKIVTDHRSGATNLLIIWAGDGRVKKLKAEGMYYRYWTVIDDGAIEVDPEKGECK